MLAAALLVTAGCVAAPATVTLTATVTVVETDPLDLSYLVDADPAVIDNRTLPVTPMERMHTIGIPREIKIDEYVFSISGLVDNPLALNYAALKGYPAENRVVLLICPKTFADNPRWTGVPLVAILAAAGVRPGAKEVVLRSVDGFEIPLPLELTSDILLAYEVNGKVLTPGHGYPLRAVVRGRIGLYWLRWLTGVQVR